MFVHIALESTCALFLVASYTVCLLLFQNETKKTKGVSHQERIKRKRKLSSVLPGGSKVHSRIYCMRHIYLAYSFVIAILLQQQDILMDLLGNHFSRMIWTNSVLWFEAL